MVNPTSTGPPARPRAVASPQWGQKAASAAISAPHRPHVAVVAIDATQDGYPDGTHRNPAANRAALARWLRRVWGDVGVLTH
jgi:hypothetical protein